MCLCLYLTIDQFASAPAGALRLHVGAYMCNHRSFVHVSTVNPADSVLHSTRIKDSQTIWLLTAHLLLVPVHTDMSQLLPVTVHDMSHVLVN
jgi:hypothetical protein